MEILVLQLLVVAAAAKIGTVFFSLKCWWVLPEAVHVLCVPQYLQLSVVVELLMAHYCHCCLGLAAAAAPVAAWTHSWDWIE